MGIGQLYSTTLQQLSHTDNDALGGGKERRNLSSENLKQTKTPLSVQYLMHLINVYHHK